MDTSGNLYVADVYNNRVLEYANPFTACDNTFPCVGGPANVVLGQGASFTSNGCDYDTGGVFSGASAIDLCYPEGVAVDGVGNLYVADASNSRVLEYNAPLITGAAAAWSLARAGASPPTRAISTAAACPLSGRPPQLTSAIQLESDWTARATSTSPIKATTACWSTTLR